MATLVLGAVGTLVGGPLGGALGGLLGRQLDGKLLAPRVEGPRLKELQVSGSSYGEAVARHYGTVRTAGTIVWATDLKESTASEGGGKGQPSITSYSYSASLAVLLSSAPIDGVGRIWADGNLLRGAAGDLKVGGAVRVYSGCEDQRVDPLMAAALGQQCNAYRGCAYVVFEDLDLTDFGNRIPALSFEVRSGDAANLVAEIAKEAGFAAHQSAAFSRLKGFSYDGGSVADVLRLSSRLDPVAVAFDEAGLTLRSSVRDLPAPVPLGPAAAWDDGEFGARTGYNRERRGEGTRGVGALRYYDSTRDFQPGLQRACAALADKAPTLEFPGVFAAADARSLVNEAALRDACERDLVTWRMAEVDPRALPGALVTLPGHDGLWQVTAWEWRTGGVELSLRRHRPDAVTAVTTDPGAGNSAADRLVQPTLLAVFDLPWDGQGSSRAPQCFAAVSAPTGVWSGASLYGVRAGELVPIGTSENRRAIIGQTIGALGPSPAVLLERESVLLIRLHDADAQLSTATRDALAWGANRALVGDEILQFCDARPLGAGVWSLHGLLRGRGGTEHRALEGHQEGAPFILLDHNLVPLGEAFHGIVASGGVAAIGRADAEPVHAPLRNNGATLAPLSPVHGRVTLSSSGDRILSWIRRARGGWGWPPEIDQPLIESAERYELGIGPVARASVIRETGTPGATFAPAEWAELVAAFPGEPLWVRQVGTLGKSPALLLTNLD